MSNDATCDQKSSHVWHSEIQTSIDHERAVAQCIRDAPETSVVNVQVRIVKVLVIHHIDGVHAQLELFCLTDLHTFGQVHVQVHCARSGDPFQSHAAESSR